MTWEKRDPISNLVILGDDEGQVQKVGGLLASIRQDNQYPSRHNYELVKQNGESVWLAGSASLSRQIFPADVGKFIKCMFLGWGKSANGKFKQIEVRIYSGEPTAEMKAWPRYGEVPRGVADDAPPPDTSQANEEDDDDLPF